MSRELITASRLAAFRRCPRLHRIRYQDLVRPIEEAGTLRFGSLIHRGLEAWWRDVLAAVEGWRWAAGTGVGDAVYDPQAALRGVLPLGAAIEAIVPAPEPADAAPDDENLPAVVEVLTPELAERIRAEEMLAAYDRRWRYAPLEPVAVEAEFRTRLVNPATGRASETYDLGGKIDVVCRRWHLDDERPSYEMVVVEHKSTSEDAGPGGAYRRRLRMDGQVSVYHDGAAALGHQVVGCIYDVLVKPSQRPLKATPVELRKFTKPTKADPVPRLYANQRETDEMPDEYRARVREALAADPDALLREEVVRLDDEMAGARADVWDTARTIRESELAGRAPRNPAACQAYGRDCDFWPHCADGVPLADPTRYRRVDTPHTELAAQAIAAATTEEV